MLGLVTLLWCKNHVSLKQVGIIYAWIFVRVVIIGEHCSNRQKESDKRFHVLSAALSK